MILIVDDDPLVLKSLKRVLEKAQYTVMTAADGVEAYDMLKKHPCRCMVLDVEMNRLNGPALLLLLQAEGICIPTVVMASLSDYEAGEFNGFGNVVKFIHKPFPGEELLQIVRPFMQEQPNGKMGGLGALAACL